MLSALDFSTFIPADLRKFYKKFLCKFCLQNTAKIRLATTLKCVRMRKEKIRVRVIGEKDEEELEKLVGGKTSD
jgi:hypothetical protein